MPLRIQRIGYAPLALSQRLPAPQLLDHDGAEVRRRVAHFVLERQRGAVVDGFSLLVDFERIGQLPQRLVIRRFLRHVSRRIIDPFGYRVVAFNGSRVFQAQVANRRVLDPELVTDPEVRRVSTALISGSLFLIPLRIVLQTSKTISINTPELIPLIACPITLCSFDAYPVEVKRHFASSSINLRFTTDGRNQIAFSPRPPESKAVFDLKRPRNILQISAVKIVDERHAVNRSIHSRVDVNRVGDNAVCRVCDKTLLAHGFRPIEVVECPAAIRVGVINDKACINILQLAVVKLFQIFDVSAFGNQRIPRDFIGNGQLDVFILLIAIIVCIGRP